MQLRALPIGDADTPRRSRWPSTWAARQKKPDRFAGRFFAWLMNGSHVPLTDWAFTHLGIPEGAVALDVGWDEACPRG